MRSLSHTMRSMITIRASAKKLLTLIRRTVCVPKCISCGKRLPVFTDNTSLSHGIPCLCEKCLRAWSIERSAMCHSCGKTASLCTCIPKGCKLIQPTVPSLIFYHPEHGNVSSHVIFTVKHKKHRDMFAFAAAELSAEILKFLSSMKILPSSCIITYIPRSRSSLRENGFDQGIYLSGALSSSLGDIDVVPLLKRDGGREQKKLATKERRKNASASFFIDPSLYTRGMTDIGPLKGKNIILIDDVMTSGASASRCAELLKSAGAENVIFAAVARCELKKGTAK